MSKLPVVEAEKLEKLLFLLGFYRKRQKGSHVFYKHLDGRYTTIPFHTGRKISRPLLRQILNQIQLLPENYLQLLKTIK